MDAKPIPAFYCCYLLRSTIRHSSLYVGSTPNPPRRLAQHNGEATGGAVRTSRISLRPWEMSCIVAGFPSNIAALQFEWAWHNAHMTRHIPPDERITIATTRIKTSSRTGKTRKRPGRPHTSLTDKLSNLHLLLRTKYFSKWPLEVRFFCENVYRVWQTWCERVDNQIRSGINIKLDLKKHGPEGHPNQPPPKRRKIDLMGKGGVDGLDPTYEGLRAVLEKGRFVFDDSEQLCCDVCKEPLVVDRDLVVLCPHGDCRSTSHVTCLAKKFLQEYPASSLVPSRGQCPTCRSDTLWPELMKATSLRTRGDKEVRNLLKWRRREQLTCTGQAAIPDSDEDGADLDDNSDHDHDEEDDGSVVLASADVVDEDEDEDEDGASVTSLDSRLSDNASIFAAAPTSKSVPGRLDIVIEDSEDDVEILSS